MERTTVGAVIRSRREELGRSQEQLAKEIGVSREWISKIENSRVQEPSWSVLRGIARALELPGDYLLQAAGYEVVPFPPRKRTLTDLARELLALAEELEQRQTMTAQHSRGCASDTFDGQTEEIVYSARRELSLAGSRHST